ncbi:MAG: gamma-glutamyltransferase [Chryseolinea sp.]
MGTKPIPVKMNRVMILLFALALVACTVAKKQKVSGLIADSAMVVSAHPLASRVGKDVLRKGGNAVDAAIATQLALAVVYPSAGNIGGGGFMLLRKVDGSVDALDYREKAPALATSTMYLDSLGNVKEGLSYQGHLASGVPGTIAGLQAAHQKYGTLPWSTLVQPAIDLALKGFTLTEREASGLNYVKKYLEKNNTRLPTFMIRDRWQKGDSIRFVDLGHTLERIRDLGGKGFYEGVTADSIVAEMTRGKGLVSYADLKQYEAIWRTPIQGQYKEYNVISMPPPSSGGVALFQLLNSTASFPLRSWGHNSVRAVHLMTEAERRAYADRSVYLGDPDFFAVPVKKLVDKEYVRERMMTFDPDKATPSQTVKEGMIVSPESEQTTHFSIVDAKGNAVAVTTTLNGSYGSFVVVSGAGFLMNNEMDDFSSKPGVPNMYGAVGGVANKIEPDKRMLSSMTPTILEKNKKLFMVVGTPGGTTIITSVYQTILNVVEYGMNMQEAVTARRFHSQWLPDIIEAETGSISKSDSLALTRMGHQFVSRRAMGRVDAIRVLPDGRLEGGADPRGDDAAEGF